MLITILLSLLIHAPTESPWFDVIQKDGESFFICRTMVKSIYDDSECQPFSFPIPSLKIREVGIGSRKVEIFFRGGASIVVYPTLQDGSDSREMVNYMFHSATIQNTRFRIRNNQLRTNSLSVEIVCNIGRIIVSCHPEQRKEMLLPLLGSSWESVSNIENHIVVTEKKSTNKIALSIRDSQDDLATYTLSLPKRSKYIYYFRDGNICIAYSGDQFVLINQDTIIASRAMYGLDSPLNVDLDPSEIEIIKREEGPFLVTFIAKKELIQSLVGSVSVQNNDINHL